MAGGLFDNQPFALNIKCIIFSLLLAAGYWFLPQKNLIVIVALLYFPYLALAWYDYYYDCRKGQLQPTVFPFGEYVYLPFKPPDYQQRYNELSQERKDTIKNYGRFIAAIILGIVGLFFVSATA
jgi:hypothetical protein